MRVVWNKNKDDAFGMQCENTYYTFNDDEKAWRQDIEYKDMSVRNENEWIMNSKMKTIMIEIWWR